MATRPGTPSRKPAFVHPFDERHGTDTSGLLPAQVIAQGTGARLAELTAYYGVAPSILQGIIDRWLSETRPAALIDRWTFLDIGAGKGRAMLLAALNPFRAVEGIELNATLAALARANIDRYNAEPGAPLLAPAMLHQADATTHPLPAGPVLLFLFHPFEAPVLKRFIAHIRQSIAAEPRPVDLIYVNAEHGSLLDTVPRLEQVWQGRVPMSDADYAADLAEIAQQKEYGSTGDELCMIYRFLPQKLQSRRKLAKS